MLWCFFLTQSARLLAEWLPGLLPACAWSPLMSSGSLAIWAIQTFTIKRITWTNEFANAPVDHSGKKSPQSLWRLEAKDFEWCAIIVNKVIPNDVACCGCWLTWNVLRRHQYKPCRSGLLTSEFFKSKILYRFLYCISSTAFPRDKEKLATYTNSLSIPKCPNSWMGLWWDFCFINRKVFAP